jgi:hypothetical protein
MPVDGRPAVFKTVCGLQRRMRRTACQPSQLQSPNAPMAASHARSEFNEPCFMTALRSLTAACSTVELLRNGSPEF